MELVLFFISASLINNFTLYYFLGLCPFFGVSGKIGTAFWMGIANIFVLLIAFLCTAFLNAFVLKYAEFLRLICYIVVIASTVQLTEMIIRKVSKALFDALGIFLPLITTNCAILGMAIFNFNRQHTFGQGLFYALGAGVGLTLALIIMAGLREETDVTPPTSLARGTAMSFLIAGILSMAFMGFAGLFSAAA